MTNNDRRLEVRVRYFFWAARSGTQPQFWRRESPKHFRPGARGARPSERPGRGL